MLFQLRISFLRFNCFFLIIEFRIDLELISRLLFKLAIEFTPVMPWTLSSVIYKLIFIMDHSVIYFI